MSDDATLQTRRLVLGRLDYADVPEHLNMDADPQVTRYTGGPAARVPRALWLKRAIASGWPAGGGMWTVRHRDDGRYCGWCGLFPIPLYAARYGPKLYEIGYRYQQHAWGRGIATEAARKVLDHGFRVLAHDPIVAVTDPYNNASQHVLQKIGLRREGERIAYGLSLPFFVLTRARYERQASPAG